MTEPDAPSARSCPWCSASVPDDATACPACGAALAQRESLGDVAIPGVTSVDPALRAYDAQPLHLKAASPTQGLAAGVLPAAALGGPIGLAAIGGIAAIAAAEYMSSGRGHGSSAPELAEVGRPSEAALLAVRRLERGEGLGEQGMGGEEASRGPEPRPPDEPRPDEPRLDGSA